MTEFKDIFEKLTGHKPFSWQCRLYTHWLAGDIVPVIDLPTGMGKTNVMAIWFLARAQRAQGDPLRLPTRLVYVVDRRTVVDQATTVAKSIMGGAAGAGLEAPTISTLRGQFADNRDWTRNPSKPAIIIGTVDMIGSRLLFSGYRSSYKMRPLEAGLLGQDSLLILDEAHLSEPFGALTKEIKRLTKSSPRPLQIVHMSATSSKPDAQNISQCFKLEDSDLVSEGETNQVVRRYQAEKRLFIHEGVADLMKVLAAKAIELASDDSRVVVFVKSPIIARKIADAIEDHGTKKEKPYKHAVRTLTGTMRGLERDELMRDDKIMKRFLSAGNEKSEGPAILVSTSAGEVGFDLNADHLICDAAPLDSIIQRFGRVNRRGDGIGDKAARVHLYVEKPKEKKAKSDKNGRNGEISVKNENTIESASLEAIKILHTLPKDAEVSLEASPKALAALDKKPEALSPKPRIVEVTDILLDAWSMTTIVEPMPGRPPVADWIRGIADDQPGTTFAWRAELDIEGFDSLEIEDVEEWFDSHPVLPHETLEVPTYEAQDWLRAYFNSLPEEQRTSLAKKVCIMYRAGLSLVKLGDLIASLENDSGFRRIANADITLPASFGGISTKGLLKEKYEPAESPFIETEEEKNARSTAADVADEYGGDDKARYRMIFDDEEKPLVKSGAFDRSKFSRFTLELPRDGDTCCKLISCTPKWQRPDFGSERQSLYEHVKAVQCHATEIANKLKLTKIEREALEIAAERHDTGKDRDIWQAAVRRGPDEAPVGKSGGAIGRISGDYRHEFGSLRELVEATDLNLTPEVHNLAMHLIATHHGRGRPHFPKGGFDPDARAKSPELTNEALRRFGRLQRKYGWWYLAWLESLLRCADGLASAEKSREGQNGKA